MAETDVKWPIDTDDEVEALARHCGWDNRKYMTPSDYAIWCERMRKFARAAALSEPVAWQHRLRVRRHGGWSEWTEWLPGMADRVDELSSEYEDRPLYAAPRHAEVERGAVTDETVRLACPQCDFGIGLHEPGCGQLPAALASPTPAPESDAIEPVSGKTAPKCQKPGCGAIELVGKPCSDRDCPQQWVCHTDHQRALASEKARADRLEAAHDATCNVLADTERRRMNAEAELAKLRGALLEISSMHLAEGEDDDREGLSALLSRIRVRALRPTTSEEGKAG